MTHAELIAMTDDELLVYREQMRVQSIDDDEDFNGPCRARTDLIDAIVADRKRFPAT